MKIIAIAVSAVLIVCAGCEKSSSQPETPKKEECGKIVVEGVTYTLSPCTITETLIRSSGEKAFSTTIIPSDEKIGYGFTRYGYGEGLPTYSILGVASGGASGKKKLDLVFNPDVLPVGTYEAYVPIRISISGYGSEASTLKLKINLTVKQ